MRLTNFLPSFVAFLATLLLPSCQRGGEFVVNPPFANGTVLQQNATVVIHGKATPGAKLSLTADWDFSVTTSAGPDSLWSMTISTPAADTLPHTVRVSTLEKEVVFNDILVGEVWLMAGQAGLTKPFDRQLPHFGSADTLSVSGCDSLLRFFNPVALSSKHEKGWTTERQAMGISPVMMNFSRLMRDSLRVPVGIIQVLKDEAPCVSWIADEMLKTSSMHAQFEDVESAWKQKNDEYLRWVDNLPALPRAKFDGKVSLSDVSIYDEYMNLSIFNVSKWRALPVPHSWEGTELGGFLGVAWFVKKVVLPETWVGKDLVVDFGTVGQGFVVYVNQIRMQPQGKEGFDIASNCIVRVGGENVKGRELFIAARVAGTDATAGLLGCPDGKPMRVECPSMGSEGISMESDWKYVAVAQFVDGDIKIFGAPDNDFMSKHIKYHKELSSNPTNSFDQYIAPMRGFAIRGMVASYGAADMSRNYKHGYITEHLPLVIRTLRDNFGGGDIPVLLAQMSASKYNVGEYAGALSSIREEQMTVAMSMGPSVTIVPTVDLRFIGQRESMLPTLAEVGRRTAHLALSNVYGRKGVDVSVPIDFYVDRIVVNIGFDTDCPLAVDASLPTAFEVAGADSVFFPAKALALGSRLTVFSLMVEDPSFVRYCHSDSLLPMLSNECGMTVPAFAFDINNPSPLRRFKP